MKHEPYGDPAVDHVLGLKPVDRLRGPSGDPILDEIDGILVGFAAVLKQRGGHVDIVGCRYAAAEILDMLGREKRKVAQAILTAAQEAKG